MHGLPSFNSKRDKPERFTQRDVKKRKKKYIPVAQRSRGRKKRRRKSNVDDSFSDRIRKRVNFSLKKIGMPKNFLIFHLLGYSEEDLVDHLRKYLGKKCEGCHKVELTLQTGQIDHIIPMHLARSVSDIIKLNQLKNLRFLCSECNHSKGGYYKHKDRDELL